MTQRKGLGVIAAALVLVLLAGTVIWFVFFRPGLKITTYYPTSVGIYSGSTVRVLGMPVGKVTSVTPEGGEVRVEMRINRGIDLPEEVFALQMTPSLVSDRYIQLAPAYTDGPKLEGPRAEIPRERTATPVEVDEIYQSLADFTEAMGPDGANADGALTRFIDTAHANLCGPEAIEDDCDGIGQALGESITELAEASRYFADGSDDFFGTIRNLQVFTTALAENDAQVRNFNAQMATFTSFLADERQNLGDAINALSFALDDVARFVNDHREALSTNVEGLAQITSRMAQETDAIGEILVNAPLAISNLANAYDAEAGALAARLNLLELQDIGGSICGLVDLQRLYPGDQRFADLGRQMAPILEQCQGLAEQVNAGVRSPGVTLPLGIMSNQISERSGPVPGTVPGSPAPITLSDVERSLVGPIAGGGQ
ncbi:MCE family protein [Hoyosella rhizosphaerae]|uniref:ABC transporter substrate-binding protein n=1 Tax=Hoyosella rhizosphaerae TaxID=1755582 RepID=A0A916ULI5_9ACTN|nr:MCE family protein [Hoyosella rhizosphaerae]MBN4927819.1 MCE family protein [Hoyosella rhizosphaerae]GGC76854.1 ABC transporter substrate-binding protein [Hoyosella rhizosphaerae]